MKRYARNRAYTNQGLKNQLILICNRSFNIGFRHKPHNRSETCVENRNRPKKQEDLSYFHSSNKFQMYFSKLANTPETLK